MESIVVPQHLLLLTTTRGATSQEALSSAYEPALTSTLTQLSDATRSLTSGVCLEIALPLSALRVTEDGPRASLYPRVQSFVAAVYKLICVIAAKCQINIEDDEGIDIRILLMLASSDDQKATAGTHGSPSTTDEATSVGPLVSLKTLAQCQRPWQSVFAIDGDDGDELLRDFLVLQDNRMNVRRVPKGDFPGTSASFDLGSRDARQHTSIAVGGTWDNLHIGHKLLLTMFAFMLQIREGQVRSLTVGITGDELLKNKKYAEVLESWQDRQRSVIRFLRAILDFRPLSGSRLDSIELSEPRPNGHAVHYTIDSKVIIKLVEIADPFGPTITDESISALVISAETRSGGKAVNEKREGQNWMPLDVFEVDVLDAQEDSAASSIGQAQNVAFASKLSSTNIRKKISERGKLRSKT